MSRLAYSSTGTTEQEISREHTPVRSEPNTPNDLESRTNNNVWEVGSMHADGRMQVEVIKGVYVFFVNYMFELLVTFSLSHLILFVFCLGWNPLINALTRSRTSSVRGWNLLASPGN